MTGLSRAGLWVRVLGRQGASYRRARVCRRGALPALAGLAGVGEADLPLDEAHARVAGAVLGGVRRQRELAQAEGTGCSTGVSCATLHSTARGAHLLPRLAQTLS